MVFEPVVTSVVLILGGALSPGFCYRLIAIQIGTWEAGGWWFWGWGWKNLGDKSLGVSAQTE
jgi:hypothetical protein